jgi:hypothetical protein
MLCRIFFAIRLVAHTAVPRATILVVVVVVVVVGIGGMDDGIGTTNRRSFLER